MKTFDIQTRPSFPLRHPVSPTDSSLRRQNKKMNQNFLGLQGSAWQRCPSLWLYSTGTAELHKCLYSVRGIMRERKRRIWHSGEIKRGKPLTGPFPAAVFQPLSAGFLGTQLALRDPSTTKQRDPMLQCLFNRARPVCYYLL